MKLIIVEKVPPIAAPMPMKTNTFTRTRFTSMPICCALRDCPDHLHLAPKRWRL